MVDGAPLLPFDTPLLWDVDTSLWAFVLTSETEPKPYQDLHSWESFGQLYLLEWLSSHARMAYILNGDKGRVFMEDWEAPLGLWATETVFTELLGRECTSLRA
jgi:hypothetical protein